MIQIEYSRNNMRGHDRESETRGEDKTHHVDIDR